MAYPLTAATMYLTSSVSGGVSTPANALGAPDGTYTTDTSNTSWTHTWAFDALPDPALIHSADLTFTVRHRRDAADGNDPSIDSVAVIQDATTIHTSGSSIPTVDGLATDFVFTMPKTALLSRTALSVTITTTAGGGGPSVRRADQVDSVTLTFDYEPITGTYLKYWDTAAWSPGLCRKFNGTTWEQVRLKRWTGSAWELI